MGDSVILPKWINRGNVVIGVLALVTAYLAVELDRSKQTCESLSKENSLLNRSLSGKTAPLLVCARDIPAGTIISMDMVDTKIVPSSSFPCHAFESIYAAVGREMLCSQKKGEPIHAPNLGFRFGECGILSMQDSKRFNMFIGLATPKPAEFTLAGHKVAIANAWLEQASTGHVLVKDPDFYNLSFNLKMDSRRPQDADSKIVCCTRIDNKSGFDEKYFYPSESASDETPFSLKIPAKSLATKISFRMFLSEMGKGTSRLEPKQPFQVVTFSLPQL